MASSSWKALDFSHNNVLDVPTGIREAVAKGYMYVSIEKLAVRIVLDLAVDTALLTTMH